MPERVVSTLLKIDGEQQYKSTIQNINRENGALKASIKLVDEQFRGQANTMAALIEKGKLYTSQQTLATQKLTAAQGMYDKAKAAVKTYGDEIAKLKAYVASDAEEEKKLATQLATAQENYKKAQNSTVFYEKAVTAAKTEVAKINNSLQDNAKYLDEARKSANGTATSIDGYGKQVAQAKKETQQFEKTGKEAFDTLAQALVAAGLTRSVGEIVDLFKQAADASIEFETAYTGVTKTVEGSDQQLETIKEQMKSLSTEIPLTATELSKIAEIAGQLGIETDNVSAFTETVAALTVSTNLSAEQGATQLARFAKITGMAASEYGNLGAVIVALGNNSAATESEIVDMAMNIAAAGKQVGMTQPQIMAYAAALTSAGMDAQAGGTAISKTLIEMSLASQKGGDDLKKFADVAGMSSEAFASLFKASSSDALNSFITGLASGSESAIKALDDMGITEIRQRDAILRLANAGGTLTNSINTANTAFVENTALSAEAAKFYATTESKIQLLKNSANLLAITIGDQFNPAIRDGTETLTEWTDDINEFVKNNPGAVAAVTGLAAALAVVAAAIAGGVVIVNIAIPAIAAFNAVLAANPIGIVVIALAALTAGIVAATSSMGGATEEYEKQIRKNKELRDEIESATTAYENQVERIEAESDAVEGLVDQLDSLMSSQSENKDNSAQIKNVVDQLNTAVSDLGLTYDSTTRSLNMTTDAIRQTTDAMFKQKLQAALVDRQVEAYIQLQDAQNALNVTTDLLTEKQAEYNSEVTWGTNAYGERYAIENARAIALGFEIRKLTDDQEDQTETVSNLQNEYNRLTSSVEESAGSTSEAAETMSGASSDVDALTKSVALLEQAWNDAKDAAVKAAEKTSEALTPLDDSPDKNAGKYDTILEDQTTFWDTYAKNIEDARKKGLDEGLLSGLLDGTEEDAQQLAGIVQLSQDEITKLNDAYKARTDAIDRYSTAVADAKTVQSDLYKQITSDYDAFVASLDKGDSANAAATETMDGLKKGLDKGYQKVLPVIAKIKAALAFINANSDVLDYAPHKTGLGYVPYDDYKASLHEGEAVLTKEEAVSWRAMRNAAQRTTPSASAMVDVPRTLTARDVVSAINVSLPASQGNRTINNTNVFTSADPTPSEVARETDRVLRKLVNS